MHPARRRWISVLMCVAAAGLLCPSPAPAAQKVLRILLDGPIVEAPTQELNFLAALGGEPPRTLYKLLKTIRQAGDHAEIAGIVLIIEEPEMGLAQVEELMAGLREFRAKGKKVYCYLDYGSNLRYLLACAADHITLAENSELDIVGLNAQMMFFKGLLDKIGVRADMLHVGAYKSALEPFTRTEPSKEAAENVNWLLDGLYERWLELMAEGRKLSADALRAAVDQAPLLAEQALEHKLVDEVSSFAAFKQRLHKEFGQDVEMLKRLEEPDGLKLDFENPFALFQKLQELFQPEEEEQKAGLGLVFIDGAIVTGRNQPDLFGGSQSAGSATIRAAFDQARRDEHVKAVVVRVDSPGGSALASDIMWKAATLCAKEKPLIVSMGSVAGSGGYYVSLPGDQIFADASTLTGSIGVVGGKLVWQELMAGKLGITTTEFKRGARADLMSPNRPWTEAERALVQDLLERVYAQFKGRVKTSRGDRIKGDLEQLAGGRVYTGRQALERGLVDQIGGLKEAMQYAAGKAGLGKDYAVYIYPKPLDIMEVFKRMLGEDVPDEYEIAAHAGGPVDDLTAGELAASHPLLQVALPLLQQVAPDQAREIGAGLRNLTIIARERVGCFMPALLLSRQ